MTRSTLLAITLFLAVGGSVPAQDAADTLKRIGVKKGICALVGEPGGKLALDLVRGSELLVYVQMKDGAKAAALRGEAEKAGFLGSRVYVEQGTAGRIHLADNVADAVVVVGEANREEVLRVLQPGGKALLGDETVKKPFPEGADDWSHPYHGPDNNPQSKDTLARGPFMTQFMSEPWYSAMHHFSVFSGGRIFKVMGNRTSTQAHWASLNTLMALNA